MKGLVTVLLGAFLVLNRLGGFVGGIWLLVVGHWMLVLIGIGMGFFMPKLFLLVTSIPTWIVSLPLFALAEKQGHNAFVVAGGFFVLLWHNIIIGIWVAGGFVLFMQYGGGSTTFPLLVWTYAVTMGPLIYMAKHETHSYDGQMSATFMDLLFGLTVWTVLAIVYFMTASFGLLVFVAIGLALVFTIFSTLMLSKTLAVQRRTQLLKVGPD